MFFRWLIVQFARYENEELTDTITAWARKHCKTFTNKGDAEQPFEHTNLYNDYCTLFEDLIEGFLRRNDMSTTEFYKALQNEQGLCERGGNMKGINTTFGSVLLSATDFLEFCQMMYDVNQGGEAVFCPPLIDCGDDMVEDVKAESKLVVDYSGDNDYNHNADAKSQCK